MLDLEFLRCVVVWPTRSSERSGLDHTDKTVNFKTISLTKRTLPVLAISE
jgi:hypothetical protein